MPKPVLAEHTMASVASIGAKDLKDIPINSAAEALNGRLAGVTASTAEGSPDAQVRVRVRGGMSITGDNSPLYIVDGVQVENGLSAIAPQNIQTIDVLKDAAATAIYGARGANGVIVITTKSAKNKSKLNVEIMTSLKRVVKGENLKISEATLEKIANKMELIANEEYVWERISNLYGNLFK